MVATVEAHGVGRVYGRADRAVGLHELTLVAQPGQVVALLGHNGAGKTTAVRGLTTLTHFDRGRARVAGFDVRTEGHRVRERIALVGQGAAVDDRLTARQNLVLFARLRGLGRADARRRAAALLAQVGLAGAADRSVQGFSGGMRRRLDLAAGMLVRPEVMFVDEPTAGLDPAARRDLWGALRTLVTEGTTLVLTTQYLEEADALADHAVLLAHGRVVGEGTPDELKDRLDSSAIHVRFADHNDAARAVPVLTALAPATELTDGGLVATLPAAGRQSLLACVRALTDCGVSPTAVTLRRPSLDEVFLSLTEQHPRPEATL